RDPAASVLATPSSPPPPGRTQADPPPRHGNGPRRKRAMDRVGSGEKHLEDCTVAKLVTRFSLPYVEPFESCRFGHGRSSG
uniref:Uncharacterized protein n=1 Tax=Aegilops tauschii subsp. strangulata TaxID=200361 RepID=A0A453SW22_AEGTS